MADAVETPVIDTKAAEQAAAVAASSGAAATTDTAVKTEAGVAATPEPKPEVIASVVPETYDLKVPDGSTIDPAIVERTAATARALGLSNEAGQRLLDETVKDETARIDAQTAAHQALVDSWKPGGTEFVKRDEQWRAEALADPDIGGTPEKFAASVEKAQQALTKYGPELKTYLEETGLGSHPAALKFLVKIGRAMSEPQLVNGSGGNAPRKKSDAEIMYASMYNDDGSPKKIA